MNSYNYDYMNYINNIPNNSYPSNIISNYIPNNMPSSMSSSMTNSTPSSIQSNINYVPQTDTSKIKLLNKDNILEPYQGFIRGNLFGNLYNTYKNYKPAEVNPTNEKEALLEQWQQYNFALTDLNLYLDVYPNNKEALTLYNKYLEIIKQITDKYEKTYGPINLDSTYVGDNTWKWINGPWPWEGVK